MSELIYSWVEFLWVWYVCRRQKNVFRSSQRSSLPGELQEIIDESAFERARAYSLDHVDMLVLKTFYDTLLSAGLIVFSGLQLLWNHAEALVGSTDEVLVSCVFVFLLTTITTLAWLPVEIYIHFFLEEKHGFNRMSVGFYAKDRLKVYVLSQVTIVFLTYVTVEIAMAGGDYFYLYVWVFLVLVSFFMNAVYPDYIAPLFDTFSSLPEGELRYSIGDLTSRVGFPLGRVVFMNSSRRTSHSDAYQIGIYKSKRIVLYDSLLQGLLPPPNNRAGSNGLNQEEVLGIVGHELGHWYLNHILKLTLVNLAIFLVLLVRYGPSMKERALFKSFGFEEYHLVLNICVVFLYVLPPRVAVLSLGVFWLGRNFEVQADTFAASFGLAPGLRRALVKVHRDNLIFPLYDWLYSMCFHSHPPLLERLQELDKYE